MSGHIQTSLLKGLLLVPVPISDVAVGLQQQSPVPNRTAFCSRDAPPAASEADPQTGAHTWSVYASVLWTTFLSTLVQQDDVSLAYLLLSITERSTIVFAALLQALVCSGRLNSHQVSIIQPGIEPTSREAQSSTKQPCSPAKSQTQLSAAAMQPGHRDLSTSSAALRLHLTHVLSHKVHSYAIPHLPSWFPGSLQSSPSSSTARSPRQSRDSRNSSTSLGAVLRAANFYLAMEAPDPGSPVASFPASSRNAQSSADVAVESKPVVNPLSTPLSLPASAVDSSPATPALEEGLLKPTVGTEHAGTGDVAEAYDASEHSTCDGQVSSICMQAQGRYSNMSQQSNQDVREGYDAFRPFLVMALAFSLTMPLNAVFTMMSNLAQTLRHSAQEESSVHSPACLAAILLSEPLTHLMNGMASHQLPSRPQDSTTPSSSMQQTMPLPPWLVPIPSLASPTQLQQQQRRHAQRPPIAARLELQDSLSSAGLSRLYRQEMLQQLADRISQLEVELMQARDEVCASAAHGLVQAVFARVLAGEHLTDFSTALQASCHATDTQMPKSAEQHIAGDTAAGDGWLPGTDQDNILSTQSDAETPRSDPGADTENGFEAEQPPASLQTATLTEDELLSPVHSPPSSLGIPSREALMTRLANMQQLHNSETQQAALLVSEREQLLQSQLADGQCHSAALVCKLTELERALSSSQATVSMHVADLRAATLAATLSSQSFEHQQLQSHEQMSREAAVLAQLQEAHLVMQQQLQQRQTSEVNDNRVALETAAGAAALEQQLLVLSSENAKLEAQFLELKDQQQQLHEVKECEETTERAVQLGLIEQHNADTAEIERLCLLQSAGLAEREALTAQHATEIAALELRHSSMQETLQAMQAHGIDASLLHEQSLTFEEVHASHLSEMRQPLLAEGSVPPASAFSPLMTAASAPVVSSYATGGQGRRQQEQQLPLQSSGPAMGLPPPAGPRTSTDFAKGFAQRLLGPTRRSQTYNRVLPAPPSSNEHAPVPAPGVAAGSMSAAARGPASKNFLSAMYAARRSSLPSAPPSQALSSLLQGGLSSDHLSLPHDAVTAGSGRLLPGGLSPVRRNATASPARNGQVRGSGTQHRFFSEGGSEPGDRGSGAEGDVSCREGQSGGGVSRLTPFPEQDERFSTGLDHVLAVPSDTDSEQGSPALTQVACEGRVVDAGCAAASNSRRAFSTDVPASMRGDGGNEFERHMRHRAEELRSGQGGLDSQQNRYSDSMRGDGSVDSDGGEGGELGGSVMSSQRLPSGLWHSLQQAGSSESGRSQASSKPGGVTASVKRKLARLFSTGTLTKAKAEEV